jgi:hypothetical protein
MLFEICCRSYSLSELFWFIERKVRLLLHSSEMRSWLRNRDVVMILRRFQFKECNQVTRETEIPKSFAVLQVAQASYSTTCKEVLHKSRSLFERKDVKKRRQRQGHCIRLMQ